jgi:tetratricopeptide (TPR) repeat protein
LLFGKHPMPRDALPNFLTALQAGADQETAFRNAFGRNYAEMDALLAEYVAGGRGYFVRRTALVTVEAPRIEPASEVDVANALARLAYAAHRWDDAARHAQAAIAAAPTDPRGHEVLALILKEQGQAEAAIGSFQRAIDCGSKDFQPFFEVGMAAQNAAVGAAGIGTMPPSEARQVANNYERAINLRPRFLPSYQNLAGVIGVAEPWGKQDREFFEFGLKLYPRDPMILLGLAILSHRAGEGAAARAQLREVLGQEDLKTSTRTFARRLDETWAGEDIMAEVKRLIEEHKTREALALVDRTLAGDDLAASFRRTLVGMQQQLQGGVRLADYQDALREQRWADAERLGLAIIDSGAPPQLKTQVRRMLDSLQQRKAKAGAK